jgi:glycosyltransferase involved in cell wall biosynthesis
MMWRAPGSKVRSADRREASVRPVVFVIPGDLFLPTGGYAYDRRVLELADKHGLDMGHLALPGSYPSPTDADLARTAHLIAETPEDAILLIDGLAYGAMPPELIRGFNRRICALVHHPLGLESGVGEERSRALIENETQALALAEKVIVTSPLTARTLIHDFAAPQEKLVVAEPGVDPRQRAEGSGEAGVAMLAVGAVSARKGYDVMIQALAPLADRDWTLTIAGATDRAPHVVEELQRLVAARGLERRIEFSGAVSDADLESLFNTADLFLMASHYEGYGMVLAEAMAHGLPIVTTTGGAAAETVPDDAALKAAPGDIDALGAAIARALDDATLRQQLSDASWKAGQNLPRWNDTAARVAGALKEMMR